METMSERTNKNEKSGRGFGTHRGVGLMRAARFSALDNLESCSSLFRHRNDVVGRRSTSLKQPGRVNTGSSLLFFIPPPPPPLPPSVPRGALARAHLAQRRDEARKRARSRRNTKFPSASRAANPGREQTF